MFRHTSLVGLGNAKACNRGMKIFPDQLISRLQKDILILHWKVEN